MEREAREQWERTAQVMGLPDKQLESALAAVADADALVSRAQTGVGCGRRPQLHRNLERTQANWQLSSCAMTLQIGLELIGVGTHNLVHLLPGLIKLECGHRRHVSHCSHIWLVVHVDFEKCGCSVVL